MSPEVAASTFSATVPIDTAGVIRSARRSPGGTRRTVFVDPVRLESPCQWLVLALSCHLAPTVEPRLDLIGVRRCVV